MFFFTDHQQVKERPDGGGEDPAEIRTTPQHHHPEGRESPSTEFYSENLD